MLFLSAATLDQTASGEPEDTGTEATAAAAPDLMPFIALAIYEGRLVQARAMLDNLAQDTTSTAPETRLLWAELAVAQGRFDEAQTLLATGGFGVPLQCRVDAALGAIASEAGNMDRAIGLLGDATLACPQDWRSWNRLAILLVQRQEYEASHYAFRQAIDQSHGTAMVLGNHAFALMQQGKVKEAASALASALEQQPEDPRLLALADRLRGMQGIEPVKQNSESPDQWAMRLAHAGQGAKQAGHINLAKALFARALLESPRFDAESWSSLQDLMESAP